MLAIALIVITLKPTYSFADVVSDKRGDFVMEFVRIYGYDDKWREAMKFISRDFFKRTGIDPLVPDINSYRGPEHVLIGICDPFVDVRINPKEKKYPKFVRFKVVEESGKLAIVPYDQGVDRYGYISPWWQNVQGHLKMRDSDC
jgi:hypothetical protein